MAASRAIRLCLGGGGTHGGMAGLGNCTLGFHIGPKQAAKALGRVVIMKGQTPRHKSPTLIILFEFAMCRVPGQSRSSAIRLRRLESFHFVQTVSTTHEFVHQTFKEPGLKDCS